MIGILFTGGTISMKLDPSLGAAVPAFGAADILAQAPGLEDVAELEVEDFSRLPGPHVTPDQMWRLARRAAAWLDRPDVDGLVITHGTDTIEETAFLLDLVLLTDKPVVLVVMDDHVLPAREVRKVHTESSGSFATPEFGPLGQVDAGVVRFRRRALPRPDWQGAGAGGGLRIGRLETSVGLLQVYTGMDPDVVKPFLAGPAKGLAVVAFGRGNVPPAIMPTLEQGIAAGTLVTVSTRCVAGRVSPRYGYDGGGMQLKRIGAILAADLSGAKARLLQMVALGGSTNVTDARALIERAIA